MDPLVEIFVGEAALSDPTAWYHVFYRNGSGGSDFDSSSAVTVCDISGTPIKGNVMSSAVSGKISFSYSYDYNSQAGLLPGTDKEIVVLVEGDESAAQAVTFATITRTPLVSILCSPPAIAFYLYPEVQGPMGPRGPKGDSIRVQKDGTEPVSPSIGDMWIIS